MCNPTLDTVNNNNRFATSQGYAYDADGNLTQDVTGQRFGYDSENRQIAFFGAANSGSTPDATYYYDGEGNRVKKVATNDTTTFVYDASSKLVAEYSSTTPGWAPVFRTQLAYVTDDHLGSTRILTDQNGGVIARKDFTAYGEAVTSSQRVSGNGYGEPTVRQDYTGYQKDSESGLEFAQARYYHASHGRFTSVDPLPGSAEIRDPQSFNRYAYSLNSPYKFTDPLGLFPMGGGGCSRYGASCYTIGGGDWFTDSGYRPSLGSASNQIRNATKAKGSPSTGSPASGVPVSPPPLMADQNPVGRRLEPTCRGGCAGPLGTLTTAVFETGPINTPEEQVGGVPYPPELPVDRTAPGFNPISPVRILRKWTVDFTMLLLDDVNLEKPVKDYQYEVSYAGPLSDPSTVLQSPTGVQKSDGGRAFLGTFLLQKLPMDPDKISPDYNLRDGNYYTQSGTVTIYGIGGRTSKIDFTVTFDGQNAPAFTSPTVVTWTRPR